MIKRTADLRQAMQSKADPAAVLRELPAARLHPVAPEEGRHQQVGAERQPAEPDRRGHHVEPDDDDAGHGAPSRIAVTTRAVSPKSLSPVCSIAAW